MINLKYKIIQDNTRNRFESLPLLSPDNILYKWINLVIAAGNITTENRSALETYFKTLRVLSENMTFNDLLDLGRVYADRKEVLSFSVRVQLPDQYFDNLLDPMSVSREHKDLIKEQYFESLRLGYMCLKEDVELIEGLLDEEGVGFLKSHYWQGDFVNIPVEDAAVLDVKLLEYFRAGELLDSNSNNMKVLVKWCFHNHPLENRALFAGDIGTTSQGHHFSYGPASRYNSDLPILKQLNTLSGLSSPRGFTLIDPSEKAIPHNDHIRLVKKRILMDFSVSELRRYTSFNDEDLFAVAKVIVDHEMGLSNSMDFSDSLMKLVDKYIGNDVGVLLSKLADGSLGLDRFLNIPDRFRELVAMEVFDVIPIYVSNAQLDRIHERTSAPGKLGIKNWTVSDAGEFIKLTSVHFLEQLRNEFDINQFDWWTRNDNRQILSDEVLAELYPIEDMLESNLLHMLFGDVDSETAAAFLLMHGDTMLDQITSLLQSVVKESDEYKPEFRTKPEEELDGRFGNGRLGLIGQLMSAISLEEARELSSRIRDILQRHSDAGTLLKSD